MAAVIIPQGEELQKLWENTSFHSVHEIDNRERVLANTRVFTGDGSRYLKVPGLLKLETVRLSGITLPPHIVHTVPIDTTFSRYQEVKVPMVIREVLQDGTPVLLRNRCSNDGIWQDGESIFVTGEWDESVPAPAPPPVQKRRSNPVLRA